MGGRYKCATMYVYPPPCSAAPTRDISEYSSLEAQECLQGGMGEKVCSASPGPVVISYTSALSHGVTQYLH